MKTQILLLFAAFTTPAFCVAQNSVSTPEPSTIVMLSIGAAGIGFAAWRRSRKK